MSSRLNRYLLVLQTLQAQLVNLHYRHPKRVIAMVAAALMVGGTASYAVATFGPDAAKLPVHELTETVQSLPIPGPEDSSFTGLHLYRSEQTNAGESPERLLARLGVADSLALQFIRKTAPVRKSLFEQSGRLVTVEANEHQQLEKLVMRWIKNDQSREFQRLVIERQKSDGFVYKIESGLMTPSTQLASGIVKSASLYAATDEARIPESVSNQLAEIFSGSIDFHHDLHKGDQFTLVYESLEADGEPMRPGRVLSAEFVHDGKTHSAVWFKSVNSTRGAYYNLQGKSLARTYLSAPLAYTRVTSGMGMRMHPINQVMQQHTGVDYGAPSGTPVRSVADGRVDYAGWKNGYGNVVTLKHQAGHSTIYAHLSRMNVRAGEVVSQGQIIGAVGSTGISTGPHLHFEFRVNGVYQNPSVLANLSSTQTLTAASRPQFAQQAQQARIDLDAAASMSKSSVTP